MWLAKAISQPLSPKQPLSSSALPPLWPTLPSPFLSSQASPGCIFTLHFLRIEFPYRLLKELDVLLIPRCGLVCPSQISARLSAGACVSPAFSGKVLTGELSLGQGQPSCWEVTECMGARDRDGVELSSKLLYGGVKPPEEQH